MCEKIYITMRGECVEVNGVDFFSTIEIRKEDRIGDLIFIRAKSSLSSDMFFSVKEDEYLNIKRSIAIEKCLKNS